MSRQGCCLSRSECAVSPVVLLCCRTRYAAGVSLAFITHEFPIIFVLPLLCLTEFVATELLGRILGVPLVLLTAVC